VRIVSYSSSRGVRAGVLRDGGVVDVADSVRGLIAAGEIPVAAAAGEAVPLDEIELGVPVPDPDKIVCIGLNYRSHAAEAGIDPPAVPTFFAKFRNALVPTGASVPLPSASNKVDTLLNDLSARDLQFATPQWMPGKIFDGSAPCGPALVTPDEAGPHDAIEIELTLNGETMQSASTSDLIFSVPALLAHLSSLMTLEPGDIVSTGTPSGVGSVREPRVWLKPGDKIAISSPTLGRLETRIA
jgi:2-keto-4-pentenoate hydratase/2-oxohepta-3-ene-1,7-dioic acid hydratase in catechol pathway